MSEKQDRQGVRSATDLERKYNLGGLDDRFAKIMGIATDARESVDKVESSLRDEITKAETSIRRDTEEIVIEAKKEITRIEEEVNAIDSTCLHIRYSPVSAPTAEQMTEIPNESTLYMGTCNTTVKEAPTDPNAYAWTLVRGNTGEDAVILRLDSSRGTVFKNNAVSTVLSVVIQKGGQTIKDITALKATFGTGAYLQWYWQRLDDETFGVLSSTDPRFSNNGFTFTLTPADVDTKVTFRCELVV